MRCASMRPTPTRWYRGYDLVIDCSDNFTTKFLLNDLALRARKPVLFASVYQYEGQLQLVRGDDASTCLRCVWPEATRDGLVGNCAEAGVLGPVPGVFGSLQALEALKFLLDLPGLARRRNADVRSHHARTRSACARGAMPALRPHAPVAATRPPRRPWQRTGIRSKSNSVRSRMPRRAGFAIIDVRDARELHRRTPAGHAQHLPMSQLLHRSGAARSRPPLSARLRHRQAQRAPRRTCCARRACVSAARCAAASRGLKVTSLNARIALRCGPAAAAARRPPLPKPMPPFIHCSISRANVPHKRDRDVRNIAGTLRRRRGRARARTGRVPPRPSARAARRASVSRILHRCWPPRRLPSAIWLAPPPHIVRRSPAVRAIPTSIAALGGVLFDKRDYAAARAAIDAALAIDPRSVSHRSPRRQHRFHRRALG